MNKPHTSKSHHHHHHHSSPSLQLEHILGSTTFASTGITASPTGQNLFYLAGCSVIQYNHQDKQQISFYSSTKAISTLTLSSDGRYLALGERGGGGSGSGPSILIYDILQNEKIMSLVGHKYGVSCLAFTPNNRYLVSIGYKPDKQLIFWDWDHNKKLSIQRLTNKVHNLTFHSSGDYFVTAGDRHLKWWNIHEVLEGEAITLEGHPASITEEHRYAHFLDVVCGSYNCDGKVYVVTSTGTLAIFQSDNRMMERCITISP
eukprot:gene11426-12775_t